VLTDLVSYARSNGNFFREPFQINCSSVVFEALKQLIGFGMKYTPLLWSVGDPLQTERSKLWSLLVRVFRFYSTNLNFSYRILNATIHFIVRIICLCFHKSVQPDFHKNEYPEKGFAIFWYFTSLNCYSFPPQVFNFCTRSFE
jgi:hypothetical protein